MEAEDLNAFIDKLKQFKGENVEIPEEVQMGREFFTEADLNRLIGSFIVVMPSVSNYILAQKDDGDYEATVKTAFNFINVHEGRTFAQFFVDTSGTDENPEQAVKEALDSIPLYLTYEIRKIPDFQLRTGILEAMGAEVILEFGRDMGITLGDEYLVVESRVLDSGKTFSRETGLVIIKGVDDEVSVGKVIYSDGPLREGEQLRELPRLGMDTTPYVHATLVSFDGSTTPTFLAGFRQSITRGFYSFRPLVGLEMPFIRNIAWGLPFNIYLGGEWDIYLGRFQIIPMVGAGIGGAYLWYFEGTDVTKFLLTHAGGMANLTLTYLFDNSLKLVLEGGYLHWFSLNPLTVISDSSLLFQSYSGIFVGGGISIKY